MQGESRADEGSRLRLGIQEFGFGVEGFGGLELRVEGLQFEV